MSSHTTGQTGGSDNLWKRLLDNRKRRVNAWDNAQIVLADVPVNIREVKKILPLGLWPTDPPMATLFLINYPTVAYPLFPYKEAIMMIHVRTLLGQGRHCCWIIVDDDPALILGRELLGFPKKTGTFVFEDNRETVNASITRRDITVMSMTASRGSREPVPPPVFNNKTFNYGGLGQFMSFSPIWMFRPKEVVRESWQAAIDLTVNDSAYEPLARLVDGEPRNGRIVTIDIPGGSPYMLPVGLAGPFVFGRTFNMRFR